MVALVRESRAALGLRGAERAVEDKGKWGLGFLPGVPNEGDEENGENNFFLSLFCGAQAIECVLQKGSVIWNTPDAK